MSRLAIKSPHRMLLLLLTDVLGRADAATAKNCSTFDKNFRIDSWTNRGICVRANNIEDVCYIILESTLSDLTQLRAAEYNGAAGVLALLPTIGALLGAPTTEIWRLLTVVPFGGGLAMALSFGGAILPVRVEDYENDSSTDKITLGSIVSLRAKRGKAADHVEEETRAKLDQLVEKIEARMRQDECQRLPKRHLSFGLLGMVILFLGAQAAMIVVEQGGVLPWWCTSRWWMHLWYFLG